MECYYPSVSKMAANQSLHEPLAQLLTKESLASYLQELDDMDDPFVFSLLSCGPGGDSPSSASDMAHPPLCAQLKAAASSSVSPHRNTKAQHDGRVNKIRNEIHALYQQLLHAQCSSSDADTASWRRRALSERLARDRAEYENAYLKQRLAEEEKIGKEVKRLLLEQQQILQTRTPQAGSALAEDDAHVFGLLKASLDRRQTQLEASIENRLAEIMQLSFLRSDATDEDDRWDVVERGQGLRVTLEESVLVPFSPATMDAAICQHTQSGTVQVVSDNVSLGGCSRATRQSISDCCACFQVVDKVIRSAFDQDVESRFALDHASGGRQLEGLSILRRIQHECGIILLWESMSYWQSSYESDQSPHAIVRESGWSIFAPAQADIEDLSVAYCGKSYRIRSFDGSHLRKSAPLAKEIVHLCQQFHDLQAKRIENIAMDQAQQQRQSSGRL